MTAAVWNRQGCGKQESQIWSLPLRHPNKNFQVHQIRQYRRPSGCFSNRFVNLNHKMVTQASWSCSNFKPSYSSVGLASSIWNLHVCFQKPDPGLTSVTVCLMHRNQFAPKIKHATVSESFRQQEYSSIFGQYFLWQISDYYRSIPLQCSWQ
jgi:hypothetical protein